MTCARAFATVVVAAWCGLAASPAAGADPSPATSSSPATSASPATPATSPPAAAPAPVAPAGTSFVNPIAQVPYGQTEGQAQLLLKVDGLAAKAMSGEIIGRPITDLHTSVPPAATSVQPGDPVEIKPQGKTTRFFSIVLNVKDLPLGSTQKRYLRFSVNGADGGLEYTLTNAAAGQFTWSVKAPATWAATPGEPIPVTVWTGPVPANGVKVSQTALTESVTKRPVASEGLILCMTHDKCKGDALALAPSTAYQLWLYAVEDVGVYTGTFTIAANEKPDGEQITTTVYSTGIVHKIIGVIVIALGVVVAWWFTSFVRNAINRDQLLLPATLLRGTLDGLAARLKANAHGIATPKTNAEIDDLRKRVLSPAELEKAGLPGSRPLLWPAPGTPLTTYTDYIKAATDWVRVLTVVVGGIENANTMYTPASAAAVTTAIGALDALVTGSVAPDLNTVQSSVDAIVKGLHATTTAMASARLAPLAPTTVPSAQELRVEIGRLTTMAWIFVLAATTLTGAYILIFSQNGAGFGTIADYFLCLLWGFGLPAGTQLLQNGTAASVTTAFSVTR